MSDEMTYQTLHGDTFLTERAEHVQLDAPDDQAPELVDSRGDVLVYGAPQPEGNPFEALPSHEMPASIAATLDAILAGVPPDELDGYRDMARMYARSLAVVMGWEHVEFVVNNIKNAAEAMQRGDHDLARQALASVEGGDQLYSVLSQYGPPA